MFRLHDVGGQRSDRRKWLSLFDCVHAVIFCVESTSYLRVRNGVCVILESLELFTKIVNSKVFIDAAMIGFLTKIDIFKEKVKSKPITIAFSNYTGPQEYHPSIQYISEKFKETKKSGPKAYCHLTCVVDTSNIRFVINSVTDLLIKNFLKDCGIYWFFAFIVPFYLNFRAKNDLKWIKKAVLKLLDLCIHLALLTTFWLIQ